MYKSTGYYPGVLEFKLGNYGLQESFLRHNLPIILDTETSEFSKFLSCFALDTARKWLKLPV